MGRVNAKYVRNNVSTGLDVPITGKVSCQLYRKEENGALVRTTKSSVATINPDGTVVLNLLTSPPNQAWRIRVLGAPDVDPIWVFMPNVEEIDLDDLVKVDPDTLEPSAEPEAAWWIALGEAEFASSGAYLVAGVNPDREWSILLTPTPVPEQN